PCYLGRHNGIYREPRELLKGILDAPLREMRKSRDRSLCCGGADVGLWYEVREEERMASRRVKMALEIGADHIVTACPFCMIHLEDAVKTMGLEERLKVVDLMGLTNSCL
ncbi:MAG: heterodisulfide reductase-related iron-sulfur binding cluster, partial [Desulfatiglandales bacterium]